MENQRKALTTPAEIGALAPVNGRAKIRSKVLSKYGAGLYVEAREGREAKSWLFRFSLAGGQREMSLGNYPAMTLKEAREAHRDVLVLVRQGIDPRRHRAAEVAKNQAAWTMREAFELWIVFYASNPSKGGNLPASRTVQKQRGRWRVHLESELGSIYVRDITRRHIISLLEQVASTAREEARQCLTLIRHLLDYCEDREQIEVNPAVGVVPKKIKASPAKSRERNLKLLEIVALWQSLDDSVNDLSPPVTNALKTLILTGARRSEVTYMEWSEITNGKWTIPAEKTKTRVERTIHLSELMQGVLESQRIYSNSPWVFESLQCPDSPIHPDTITKAPAKLQGRYRQPDVSAPLHDLTHFTVHDLRRSAATIWSDHFLADPLLVEAMLGHAPPKLIGTYNKSQRHQQQASVWDKWGVELAGLVYGDGSSDLSNVVVLGGRA